MSDLNLQAAIDATQQALAPVRVLVAAHPGDSLYYSIENRLAEAVLDLVTRQARSTTPPMDAISAVFYGID